MFAAPENYHLVAFNTERQWVTVPAPQQDPTITVGPFIAELELLKQSFERALTIYKGENPDIKNTILQPFPEKDMEQALAYMNSDTRNDEYVWDTLASPIISPNYAFSIHADAPEWHKRLMKTMGFITMCHHELYVRNDVYADFRDVALSCRIIAEGAKASAALSYARMWRMYTHYRMAHNVFACKAFLGLGYNCPLWSITRAMGTALASRAASNDGWFKETIEMWDLFVEHFGEATQTAIEDLAQDIENLKSGKDFSHTRVLVDSALGFVMYFKPRA